MKTDLPLIPANYAEILWHWIKDHPGEQAVSIAQGVGSSYSTMSHPLTRMVAAHQLERIRVQVPSQEAGKKPVSPFHYWAIGHVFKPNVVESKLIPAPAPALVTAKNELSVRDAMKHMVAVSKLVAQPKDPLEYVKHLTLPELEALRDALNEVIL